MRSSKLYFLLFIVGLGAGVFLALDNARASNPKGEVSDGEQPASVYYDEHWKATEAAVTSNRPGQQGYKKYSFNQGIPGGPPPVNLPTPTAGQLEKNAQGGWVVALSPKMIVTKWKVHGHIHFE